MSLDLALKLNPPALAVVASVGEVNVADPVLQDDCYVLPVVVGNVSQLHALQPVGGIGNLLDDQYHQLYQYIKV